MTDWMLYDTGYTERYLGVPKSENKNKNISELSMDEQNVKNAYYYGNVCTYASQFPDEAHRLVIVHGNCDENVHFSHTMELIQALIANQKPYDLKVIHCHCFFFLCVFLCCLIFTFVVQKNGNKN